MTLTLRDASELAQLMEGTTAGALIPEIVRRGFQDLLEAGVSAAVGDQLHQLCPDQRSSRRYGYRERVLTTQVGGLILAIPKLRQVSFSPNWLEPRRRADKALYAVVMEAYTGGWTRRTCTAASAETGRWCRGLWWWRSASMLSAVGRCLADFVYSAAALGTRWTARPISACPITSCSAPMSRWWPWYTLSTTKAGQAVVVVMFPASGRWLRGVDR